MAQSDDFSRVGALVLRQMRLPILAMIMVYGVAVLVMTLIPGPVVDGQRSYMSIFHAVYFMAYTATTTGFGEIPIAFSDPQRIWAIVCLYISVITWIYAIGSIINLLQDRHFQLALAEKRFTRAVKRIQGGYFVLCGFGDTGSLLARGLSDARIPAVIIESDLMRIQALKLRDYNVPTPGLCADADIPKHLQEAGIDRENCRGVVAATNDEEVNLRISAIARVLNDKTKIVTRSRVDFYEETLSTFGGDVQVIDPFIVFAKGLGTAISNPKLYMLDEWLIGAPGTTTKQLSAWFYGSLNSHLRIPSRGHWIICGYGRMGHEVQHILEDRGISFSIIDPHPEEGEVNCSHYIQSNSTAETLKKADVEHAKGIVICTDNDGHNIGILLNVRKLNPKIFTIIRQNRHANEIVFRKAKANIIMQPSLITARRILRILVAPLIKHFFKYLITEHPHDEQLMHNVLERLIDTVGYAKPHLFSFEIGANNNCAVTALLQSGETLTLGDILRDPYNREHSLPTVPLVIRSGSRNEMENEKVVVLPANDYPLREGDELLLCGRESSHRLLDSTLNNRYTLAYLITGRDEPHGWLMRKLNKRYPWLAGQAQPAVKDAPQGYLIQRLSKRYPKLAARPKTRGDHDRSQGYLFRMITRHYPWLANHSEKPLNSDKRDG